MEMCIERWFIFFIQLFKLVSIYVDQRGESLMMCI